MLSPNHASPQPTPYRSRKPQPTGFYQCVEDHFETLEQVYDERFARQYGFFRSYVRNVIYRFLDCGILHNGFARVRCGDCVRGYLLAFLCKRRHFVFSIPKILRRYFLYERTLFSELSRCAWETLKEFFQEAALEQDAVPGAVIAIHSFGDFLGWHPPLHVLCTDGCFYGSGLSACDAQAGMFRVAPLFKPKRLEELFRHKVFKMLLSKAKITEDFVDMLMKWRHSGFNVFCGHRIRPGQEEAMENLARYIIRASFSQERMHLYS